MLGGSARSAVGSPATAVGCDFDRLAPRGSGRREETDLCPPDPRAAVGREAGKAGQTESLRVFPVIGAPAREPCWEALLYGVLRDSGRTVTAVPRVKHWQALVSLGCFVLRHSQCQPRPRKGGLQGLRQRGPHTELRRFGTGNA